MLSVCGRRCNKVKGRMSQECSGWEGACAAAPLFRRNCIFVASYVVSSSVILVLWYVFVHL